MEIKGKIKVIGETGTFGNNGFRKRLVVIETQEQFPQTIPVDFTQDKCDILNSYNVGDEVEVSINLRGNSWVNPQGETKYFLSAQAWKIKKVEGQAEPMQDSVGEEDETPF